MNPKARLFRVFLVVVGFVVVFSCPAFADTFPFGLAIKDGLNLQYRGTDANGLSVFRSHGQIRPLSNWQITNDNWGTAGVIAWYHPVSDPFFSPFGPIAVLVELNFNPPLDLYAYLGLIQTPSGYQTTVAISDNKSVRGSWLFTDGALFGGTATDLVIGGFLVVGTPSIPYQANLDITLSTYFPTYAYFFTHNPSPTYLRSLDGGSSAMSGSFFGYTTIFGPTRPVRSFSYIDVSSDPAFFGHLMAVHTGGDDYYIVVCPRINVYDYDAPYYMSNPASCTLSGTGQLAPYTGDAVYLPGSDVEQTILSLYNWGLVLE